MRTAAGTTPAERPARVRVVLQDVECWLQDVKTLGDGGRRGGALHALCGVPSPVFVDVVGGSGS